MTTLLLLRHAESEWNRAGRMQGWAPVGLTDRGREQARAAGERIADAYDVDGVVASDLLRTEATVERAAPDGVEPAFEPAWRERDVGVYQGLPYQRIEERFPEFGLREPAARAADRVPDSGESLVKLRERVLAAWDAVCRDAGSRETVLVVTHGGPIRLVLGHVRGQNLEEALLSGAPDNCGLAEIEVDTGSDTPATDAEIRRENESFGD
jgi:probable phosphoglycerate mutase